MGDGTTSSSGNRLGMGDEIGGNHDCGNRLQMGDCTWSSCYLSARLVISTSSSCYVDVLPLL